MLFFSQQQNTREMRSNNTLDVKREEKRNERTRVSASKFQLERDRCSDSRRDVFTKALVITTMFVREKECEKRDVSAV